MELRPREDNRSGMGRTVVKERRFSAGAPFLATLDDVLEWGMAVWPE